MLKTLHKALLKLPPEISHSVAKNYLLLYQASLSSRAKKKAFEIRRGDYTLRVTGRVGLAAGFDKNAEIFYGLESLGFGFLEVGTVTPLPQQGNVKPRLWRLPDGVLVNHMGFNSVGSLEFKKNILKYRQKITAPLWVNIGKNRSTPNDEAHEDYWSLFEDLKDVADAFVVNLSSPNTPGLVMLQNEAFLKKLLERAPALPLFLKLSPDLTNDELKEICAWVRGEKKIYGLVLTNTSRKLALRLSRHENGGLSGPPLFERSLECVQIARAAIGESKMLIGVGGIDSISRAKKMREAGADLIEIYTSFIYQGMDFVKELSEALSEK